MLDTAPLANWLGLAALVSYILTLMPTIIRIIFPSIKATKFSKFLLKYRRSIGILSFCLSLAHGALLVRQREFDFFDWKSYWIYILGVAPFTILALLALTSNDWSVKKLKKNWKRLHQLTYLAAIVLTWHVISRMYGHWTYLTPWGILASGGIIILLLVRLWVERKGRAIKSQGKAITS